MSSDNNGDNSRGGPRRRQRLRRDGSRGAPGGSGGAPRGRPSPRRRSLFGSHAAASPEVPEVVALGSGDAVRSAERYYGFLTRIL